MYFFDASPSSIRPKPIWRREYRFSTPRVSLLFFLNYMNRDFDKSHFILFLI